MIATIANMFLKLYICVELWNTKSNVVMTYGIFPVAMIATIAETNSHMVVLIAMIVTIAQHRSLRSSRYKFFCVSDRDRYDN